jgi:serum/glucocorticoid-regulated kinase 2
MGDVQSLHFLDPDEHDEYIPPLVCAVSQGNTILVPKLLPHGANVDIGYHDLRATQTTYKLRGGRPVQLAMDPRSLDMVNLLLQTGADIDMSHSVWFHECPDTHGEMRAVRLRSGLG